jgi:hypothetical protein
VRREDQQRVGNEAQLLRDRRQPARFTQVKGEAAHDEAVPAVGQRSGGDVFEREVFGGLTGALEVCLGGVGVNPVDACGAQLAQCQRRLAAAGGQVEHAGQVGPPRLHGDLNAATDLRLVGVAIVGAGPGVEPADATGLVLRANGRRV